ncbi:LysR family transcriptional regulator [Marinomonas agarivorans]|nr:LysR family transcriptional regulator [Marinomonas agarivorans]
MALPPLKSLPVFETVARLNSFSKAATELNVTQSAVSHTIKSLEDYLGERLFIRQGRQLILTDEGQAYLESISASLLQIEQATNQLKGQHNGRFRLAIYSSFAVYWLIPRLTDFQRQHPQTDVSIEMMHLDPELSDRIGDGFITIDNHQRGFDFHFLYKERLFPVCSPQFYQQMSAQLHKFSQQSLDEYLIENPLWLTQFPLITTFSIFNDFARDWQLWFEAIGLSLPDNAILRNFSHLILGKEAALHHYGIALINDYMLEQDEINNKLIKLPCHHFETGDNFYFAHKTSRRNEAEMVAIKHWLQIQSQTLNHL